MVSYLYSIKNLLSGKQYVGKANDPDHRWKEHLACARLNPILVIDYAIRKYGAENFTFEVIGEFESEELAYLYESFEIQNRFSLVSQFGYNVSAGGRGGKAGFLLSEEVRKRISEKRKGMKFTDQHRANLSKAFTGRKHSAETRLKMSQSRQGSKNSQSKLSEEHVEIIKQCLLTRCKTQIQLAREYNVSVATIKAIKSGRLWSHVLILASPPDESDLEQFNNSGNI